LGQPEPAIDGNIERVISRCFSVELAPKSPQGKAQIRRAVIALMPPARAGDFNQALMDIGATLCLPKAVDCDACPLERGCLARQQDRALELPVKSQAIQQKNAPAVAAALFRGDDLLLVRRPSSGLLGGLWGLPGGRTEAGGRTEGTSPEIALEKLLRERLGLELVSSRWLGTVQHLFTHLRWKAVVFAAEVKGEVVLSHYVDSAWVRASERRNYPLSTLDQKTLALVDRSV
jgi:A/G-specific adenine glycosylase